MTTTAGKGITDVDREVGKRVRTARLLAGLSQEKLGEALGVSFQQIQKYEKATNRMGPTALTKAAAACNTTVGFLIGGDVITADPNLKAVLDIMATPDGLAAVKALGEVKDMKLLRTITNMVEAVNATAARH